MHARHETLSTGKNPNIRCCEVLQKSSAGLRASSALLAFCLPYHTQHTRIAFTSVAFLNLPRAGAASGRKLCWFLKIKGKDLVHSRSGEARQGCAAIPRPNANQQPTITRPFSSHQEVPCA